MPVSYLESFPGGDFIEALDEASDTENDGTVGFAVHGFEVGGFPEF